jgi:minor extracellular serine protease Vpr
MLVKPYSKKLLAVAIAAALAAPAMAADVTAIQKITPEISGQLEFDTTVKQKILAQEFPQYFIVQLESAPLASVAVASESELGNQLDLNSDSAKKHAGLLAAERAVFANNLKAALPDAQVERHYDTVLNAVVVTATDDVFEELKKLEGVTKVYREEMYYEQMDASLDLIKAKTVWEQLGGDASAGKGVKVAVIDGGIRPENPLFKDTGFTAPATKPTNDYCATTEPAFCNNKLIAARFSTPTFATVPKEYMSPLGNGGHGTHTAGTAVGVPTKIWFNGSTNIIPKKDGVEVKDGFTEVTVSGVAPAAYLMSYKALFQVFRADGTVTGSGSNVMLLEALDWAVKDGADVINNSWGGSAGANPSTSPYQAAFKVAEDAGVVVVTSAGNSGPGPQTIGCPSCIESGISVASTTTGRFFANSVTLAGGTPSLAIPGSTFASTITTLTADPKAKVIDAKVVDAANALGCNAFAANAFKDSFALISRGTCSFTIKINNAMAAGAKAVIMVQNNDGQPTAMSSPDTTIPNVMITKADGAKLATAIAADPAKEVTISRFASRLINPQFVDTMSDFSSRGPDGDNNILKPDMGAPGSDILSATSPDEFADKATFQLMSGTSMAAPHVAGAAAIMQQKFPKWTAVEIKTALTSTAVNGLKKEDSLTATTPFDIGAGRLDLSRAVKAAATFDKPSFAQNPCVGACNFTRKIRNMTDKEVTWTGTVQFTDGITTGTLDKTSVTLKPYGTAGDTADFMVAIDGKLSTYNAWAFGNVLWTSSDASAPTATMPIAVRMAATADATTLATASGVVLTPTTPTVVTNSFGNKTFDGQVTITAKAPAGTKITAGSESSTLTGATEYLLDNTPSTNRVSWTGLVNKPAVNLRAGTPIAASLKTLGSTPIACAGECDDNVVSFNLTGAGLPMAYNGVVYNRIHVSTNGFVQLSNSATAPSAAAANVKLPSTTAAVNLLAPFWTDLDLAGGAAGTGEMYIDVLTLGAKDYIVVEWNGVEEFDAPGVKYGFQVWIAADGTEDIFFNYLDVAGTPAALTVGAQDISRTLGGSTYFNNGTAAATGSLPAASSAIKVATVVGGKVDVKYTMELTGELELGVADAISTNEDAASAGVDVLANEKTSANKVIELSVKSGTETINAVNKAAFQAASALSKVTIKAQGANGTAAVVDGKVVYTPKANFNGKDSFTYTAEDSAGNKIVPTKVNVTVAAVNDAPTLAAGAAVTANEGQNASLSVVGTDIDGDALTYTWTKTSTAGNAITAKTATVTVAAPEVTDDTPVTYSVVATDGKVTTAAVTVTLNVKNVPEPDVEKGGGSMGFLSLLLLPLAMLRRRFK